MALFYLVESMEGVFRHCATIKVSTLQPGLRLELKCQQPRNKTRGFGEEIASSPNTLEHVQSLGLPSETED